MMGEPYCHDSGMWHPVFEQVSRPYCSSFAPSIETVPAKSVNEDDAAAKLVSDLPQALDLIYSAVTGASPGTRTSCADSHVSRESR